MPRFDTSHPDLFAAPPKDVSDTPEPPRDPDPIGTLRAMLERLRGTDVMPWTTVTEALNDDNRARELARDAGPEGEQLLDAFLDESERLFLADERRRQAAGAAG